MKKVLLVNLPCFNKFDDRRMQPLGISYIASNLEKNNIPCDIFDANISYPPIKINDLRNKIDWNLYDIVGLSCVTDSYDSAVELAKFLKKRFKIFIVLGGIHATFCHKQIIENYSCFDLICRGEGEEVFIDIVKNVRKYGELKSKIKGCTYKNSLDENIYANDINCIEDINNLPLPKRNYENSYSYTFIDGKKYYNIPISSSRGCPYNCSFCSVGSLKYKWRGRNPHSIIEEINEIKGKIKDFIIIFVDDNFLVDQKRVLQLSKMLIKENIIFSFATRADQILKFGEENLKILKEAGCKSVELGIENGSDTFLLRINKCINSDMNIQALNLLSKVGIHSSVDYIMYDNKTTVSELLENIKFLKDTHLLGYYPPRIYVRIIPFPGTPVSNMIKSMNIDEYFENKNVSNIYYCMDKFRNTYQTIIDQILNYIEKKDKKDLNDALDCIYLKLLPYIVFENVTLNSNSTREKMLNDMYNMNFGGKLDELYKKYIIN
ncbi:MAG: B12-binding domain-containing radical SAM protein [Bacilli bacterium]|nr:B12-binding domain-containing radical SAM protein [Bacilli bacterium]